MNPSQVSAELRRIATAINNSQNPSRERVLGDLRRVLASMDETAMADHEAGLKDMVKKAIMIGGTCLGLTGCMPSTANMMASSDAMMQCLRSNGLESTNQSDLQKCSKALGEASKEAMEDAGLGDKDFRSCDLSYEGGKLKMNCEGKTAVVNVKTVQVP